MENGLMLVVGKLVADGAMRKSLPKPFWKFISRKTH